MENISLRKLEDKDAKGMLEWMSDPEISNNLAKNFTNLKLEDCINFISKSQNDTKNVHFAICNEQGEYLGTVSLKVIDITNENAEYAICLRKKARGNGIAVQATEQILSFAFKQLSLEKVYLCVSSSNVRAIRFYQKFGFTQEGEFRKHKKTDNGFDSLLWFSILKEEFHS